MNNQYLMAAAMLLGIAANAFGVEPLGTTFTYQGRLSDGGQPANGKYGLKFALYETASGGNPVAGPITNSPVEVASGLFSTTIDFGHGVFTGNALWLEIAARTNGSLADFATLSPRQLVTPAPYALYAPNAGVANSALSLADGAVNNASLAPGAVTSDKIADASITILDLSPALASNTFWRLDGNAGTTPSAHFLGTTDPQPLEVNVNSQRA
ncbi:MAG: hypothetical protein QHJ82_14185, partial [Verrucomicrobiota bacterium]|nr:hypothetical protein [Verrucomicrobiota bacterium]